MQYDHNGFVEASDGTRLFYGVRGESANDKPTIVLNDGIGCDGFAWRYLQPHFARDHRVVHWHYRGHGRSGAPADRARLEMRNFAEDSAVILNHLDVQNAVVFGHSMGTQVSLELYRLLPKRVRGLVLICGSFGRVTHTFHGTDVLSHVLPNVIQTVKKHLGLTRAIWGRVPPKLAYRLARLSGEVDTVTIREEDFRHYWEHITVMDPDVFLATLERAGEHSAEDLLNEIDCPVLVIAAERDTFTPPSLAKYMADVIPRGEHMLIRGGSHAAPVEQPVAMQLRIEKFMLGI